VLPAKKPDAARRCAMRFLVLDALRDGPKPLREIADHVARARPEITHRQAYVRTTQAVARMKAAGIVGLNSRYWALNH
jgi:hypothetical protein